MQLDIEKKLPNNKCSFRAATAGDVCMGDVNNLSVITSTSKRYDLLFISMAPAAVFPELNDMFKGADQADSIAIDPHRWLYAPLEVR